MPSSNAQLFFVDDFTGGLNIRSNDSMLRNNECVELKNYYFPFRGGIKKRAGSLKYNSTAIGSAGEVHSIYRYYQSDGTKKFLAIEGSTLYEGNDSTGAWTSKGSVAGSGKAMFITWKDTVYFVNGIGEVRTWDGTTLSTTASSPTTCKYITYRKERMYSAGDSSNPNRLYYTDVGLPGTWDTSNNYIDISDNDGDVITGIAVLSDVLVIYKHNSIWLLYGTTTSDFAVQQSSGIVGCDAPYTLIKYEDRHFFMDRTGVYIFDGASITIISENIYNDVHGNNLGLSDITSSRLDFASSTIHDRQYYLSTSQANSTNNNIYVYNIMLGSWSRFKGINASTFSTWNGVGDEGELYSGDYAGFVHKLNTGTDDNGTNIESVYTSKYFNFGNNIVHKKMEEVFISTELTIASIYILISIDWGESTQTISFDGANTIALWDSAVFDSDKFASSGNKTHRKNITSISPYQVRGRTFSIKVHETSSNEVSIVNIGAIFSYEKSKYGKLL